MLQKILCHLARCFHAITTRQKQCSYKTISTFFIYRIFNVIKQYDGNTRTSAFYVFVLKRNNSGYVFQELLISVFRTPVPVPCNISRRPAPVMNASSRKRDTSCKPPQPSYPLTSSRRKNSGGVWQHCRGRFREGFLPFFVWPVFILGNFQQTGHIHPCDDLSVPHASFGSFILSISPNDRSVNGLTLSPAHRRLFAVHPAESFLILRSWPPSFSPFVSFSLAFFAFWAAPSYGLSYPPGGSALSFCQRLFKVDGGLPGQVCFSFSACDSRISLMVFFFPFLFAESTIFSASVRACSQHFSAKSGSRSTRPGVLSVIFSRLVRLFDPGHFSSIYGGFGHVFADIFQFPQKTCPGFADKLLGQSICARQKVKRISRPPVQFEKRTDILHVKLHIPFRTPCWLWQKISGWCNASWFHCAPRCSTVPAALPQWRHPAAGSVPAPNSSIRIRDLSSAWLSISLAFNKCEL